MIPDVFKLPPNETPRRPHALIDADGTIIPGYLYSDGRFEDLDGVLYPPIELAP